MNGPVTGMSLNRTPSSTAGTADRFSSVEKRCGHGLKSTQRVESFNPCPKGLAHYSSPCLPQGGVYRWPYAPSLIHVDQRQRNASRWSGDVVNTAAQGQQSTTPHEVREFLFSVF